MFHAPTGKFIVAAEAVRAASYNLLHALKKVRQLADLPLDRYERSGPLLPADMAQIAIIESAESLGIDLGVGRHRFNELDLRDAT